MIVFDKTKQKACEEMLQKLVSQNTAQPEGNEKALVDDIEGFFGENVEKIRYNHGGNRASLVLKFKGLKEGGIAFVGHLDTVPLGRADEWLHEPLGAIVEGGIMYGRGTADMKAGVCAMLMTALYLQEQGIILERPVYFCFTADEEHGGIGIREIIESGILNQIDTAVICEPTSNHIGIAEKGALWLQVDGEGVAAHGSNPLAGTNALECLIKIKEKLDLHMKQEIEDPLLGNSTISLTKLQGGTGKNVIPGTGVMEMDIRTIPGNNHQEILKFVKSACEDIQKEQRNFKYKIQVLNNRAPVCVQEKNPTAAEFQEVAKNMGIDAEYKGLFCYTDVSMMIPPLDIPFIIFGPGEGEQAHKINEHISLESVKKYSDIYITYILNYYGVSYERKKSN